MRRKNVINRLSTLLSVFYVTTDNDGMTTTQWPAYVYLHIMEYTPAAVRVPWSQTGSTVAVLLAALHWYTVDLGMKHTHTNTQTHTDSGLVNIAHRGLRAHPKQNGLHHTCPVNVGSTGGVLSLEREIRRGTSPLWLSEINRSGRVCFSLLAAGGGEAEAQTRVNTHMGSDYTVWQSLCDICWVLPTVLQWTRNTSASKQLHPINTEHHEGEK